MTQNYRIMDREPYNNISLDELLATQQTKPGRNYEQPIDLVSAS